MSASPRPSSAFSSGFEGSLISTLAAHSFNGGFELQTNGREQTKDLDKLVFSVIWCKSSTRKHKKWEDDGVLVTRPRAKTAVLKDLDGRELARGSGLASKELAQLTPGQNISFGGRDIEVIEALAAEPKKSHPHSLDKSGTSSEFSGLSKHRPDIIHTGVLKPFRAPTKAGDADIPMAQGTSVPRQSLPIFNTNAEQSLVLPRPPPNLSSRHEQNNNQPLVEVVVDPHLSKHLRPHQRQGVAFLYKCVMGFGKGGGSGAILADEMGLGKTLQTIALIWTLLKQGPWGGQPAVKRVLILTPSSLVHNWHMEFTKWLGRERLKVFAVDNGQQVMEYLRHPTQSPVLILSYELFVRSFDAFSAEGRPIFDLLICDEGHRLKNEKVKASTMLGALGIKKRVLLTGTPIQNDLKEFFALVNIVSPNAFGTASSFIRNFQDVIVRSKQPNASKRETEKGRSRMAQLNDIAGGFILRRTQSILSKFLPPKTESVVFCRPSKTLAKLYNTYLGSLNMGGMNNGCVLASISYLRRICNHPSLDKEAPMDQLAEETGEDSYEEQGSKLGVVAQMLNAMRPRERIVLASYSTKVLDLLGGLCDQAGHFYCRLDGATPIAHRQSIVDSFNKGCGKETVMLLSAKAGGTGLNLVGASRMLLYDMDWNPAHDVQAMARVWRDGQRRPVHIYRLVTAGTIEEKIFQRQVTKQGLSILEATAASSPFSFHFSYEDLRDLFSFDDRSICGTHDLLECSCVGGGQLQPDPAVVDGDQRDCQLGGDDDEQSIDEVISDIYRESADIKDLMRWRHFNPKVAASESRDIMLNAALATNITFLFQNVFQTSQE